MFLSSLFVILGLSIAQPIPSVPVETTTLVTATRHTFAYQENDYILDLNDDDQIVAFYINNNLQNSHLNTLFEYNAKSENDLFTLFINKKQRTVTGRYYRGYSGLYATARLTDTKFHVQDNICYRTSFYIQYLRGRYINYDSVEKLGPLSPHCPENRDNVLRYRAYPDLYYNTNGYEAMVGTDENYSWCNWQVCYWYFDEEYLTSGRWIEQKHLNILLWEANLFTMVSKENLVRAFENMGLSDFKDLSEEIKNLINSKIINDFIKRKVITAIVSLVSKKVLWSTGIGIFIDVLWEAFDYLLSVSSRESLKKLFNPSEYGYGWIVYRRYWPFPITTVTPKVW